MQVNGAQAIFGLNASVTPDATNVSGAVQVGLSQTQQRFPTATVAYSTRFLIAEGDTAQIILTTQTTSGSDAFVAGAAQVETATAAGTITLAGDASVVFTAAGLTGSPLTVSVPVALSDTAAQWAEKVRVALAANTAISAMFDIGGSTTAIRATRKPIDTFGTTPFYAANDATFNISLDNGTCTGITTAATSANTTAGVATAGAKVIDGGEKDLWGDQIEECIVTAWMIQATAGDAVAVANTDTEEVSIMKVGETRMAISTLLNEPPYGGSSAFNITATTGNADVTVTVIGGPI